MSVLYNNYCMIQMDQYTARNTKSFAIYAVTFKWMNITS